jgi:Xaa-Pro dipeptidase
VLPIFDDCLDAIEGIEGAGVVLGEREPVTPDFPLAEYQRRYARLQALMGREGLDALVLTQEEPVRYLTGYNSVIWAVGRWLPTVFVATADPAQSMLIASGFDLGAAQGTSWVSNVTAHSHAREIPMLVAAHLAQIGAAGVRVGVELGVGTTLTLPQSIARELLQVIGDEARDCSRILHALRMLKSPAEIQRIRRSVNAAAAGYRAGLQAAHAGMTEKELVSIVATTMHQNGSTAGTKPIFVNCVSGRARYPLVDSPASDNAFRDGDVVFIDGGGACDGYMSDILRLIGIGELRPEDQRYADIAAAATQAMVDAARPGIRASDLIQAGIDSVDATGCGVPVGAIAGHGIGLELWERPFLQRLDDPDEDVTLRAGMTLCLEPIMAPPHPDGGLAGIFVIEQQVLLTENGCEVLSAAVPPRLWAAGSDPHM